MSITAVIAKIDELHAHHQTLLRLGEQKREVLVRNQVNELAAIVNQENKLLKQVAETEAQWRAAIVVFLREAGVKPHRNMTVSDILQLVKSPEDRQKLQQAQQSLLATIEKIKATNGLNQQLIEQSLAFIDYSLDLFMGDSGQDVVYRKPAQSPTNGYGKPRRLFDTRA